MKKILIVSFYELKEYLLSISDIFIDTYKWDVCYYPLFMYYKDAHNKIDNYKEHFSEFISENKPDIILWWYYGVPIDIIHYIKLKHPEIFYIIYDKLQSHVYQEDPRSWYLVLTLFFEFF